MEPSTIILASLALLAAPGPTNALLAAAGAVGGIGCALPLLAAAIAGYIVAILVLSLGLGGLIEAWPILATTLKLAASLWLACCALRLWRRAACGFGEESAPLSPARVFLTTLVNPKSLIFALVILPRGDLGVVAPWLVVVSALTALVGLGWIGFGAALARSATGLVTPRRVWRTAALALALFATIMAGTALAGVL
jgi:threonine/homoserine/homoserine lactone efflux protein